VQLNNGEGEDYDHENSACAKESHGRKEKSLPSSGKKMHLGLGPGSEGRWAAEKRFGGWLWSASLARRDETWETQRKVEGKGVKKAQIPVIQAGGKKRTIYRLIQENTIEGKKEN